MSAGFLYTCGLTSDGAAYCWGTKGSKLGDGTTLKLDDPRAVFLSHPQSTPVLVAGGVRFAFVQSGSSHTCALTAAGAAYCWGNNRDGELGDETTSGRPTPTPVAGGLTFSSVSAGFNHACGVTPAGVAYCWGSNDQGQLGDGSTTDRSGPAPVAQ